MNDVPSPLWHYTCKHFATQIVDCGIWLRPWPQAGGWGKVIWLTDLATPDIGALGLTSTILACDRTEYRFRVAPSPHIVSWRRYLATHRVPLLTLAALGRSPADPDRWWVSSVPVQATLDIQVAA